jgi:Domain of unknown function (DUF4845)
MKPLRTRQTGLTLGGLIVVLVFIGLVVTFLLRAFPLYNEKFQILSAMTTVANNPASASMSEKELQFAFLKNINATTNIQRFHDSNLNDYIHLIKPEKKGQPKILHISYQATNVLFKDLNLLLNFDEKMPLKGKAESEE